MTAGAGAPFGAGTERLRPDIQALRALAVGAVLVYHLWPNRLTGGFVGVDVFFVISGFLITSHLLRELDSAGTIRVGRFWSRRAKRLLPDALLVLLLTGIATILVVPRTLWPQFLSEIVASTLYVQNWLLASNSVDYSAADNTASPVQHFWTLSVEEQFYIGLPLLLLVVALVARRRALRAGRLALGTIAVVSAASLAFSIWFTFWSESAAYFSTLTRVWEFGIGALIVAVPPLASRVARQVVAASGLAAIGATFWFFDSATPFPGATALLPVLGTAAVIWAGTRTFADTVGAWAPVALLGRISYAVYLWHWPPIVLLPWITGHPLTTWEKLGILVGAIAVAWLATAQWEDRIRFSPRLLGAARPRTIAFWSAGAMAVVVALPLTMLTVDAREAARSRAVVEQLVADLPPCLGAASRLDPGCENPDLDGLLIPRPADAGADSVNRSECWSTGGDATLNVCSVGPDSGYTKHLIAVGDSHNNALLGAYESIADAYGWRIDVAGRAGCYWTDADLVQPTAALEVECGEWRASLDEYMSAQADIDAIIATKARRPLTAEVATVDPEIAYHEVVDGMVRAWGSRNSLDVPVIAILDNPRIPAESRECVDQNGLDAAEICATPRAEALQLPDGLLDAAEADPNAVAIDLTDLYCTDTVCPPVIGHVVVYSDGRHLTGSYSRTVAPILGERLAQALDGLSR